MWEVSNLFTVISHLSYLKRPNDGTRRGKHKFSCPSVIILAKCWPDTAWNCNAMWNHVFNSIVTSSFENAKNNVMFHVYSNNMQHRPCHRFEVKCNSTWSTKHQVYILDRTVQKMFLKVQTFATKHDKSPKIHQMYLGKVQYWEKNVVNLVKFSMLDQKSL